jgi:hypothetical protein
MATPNLNITELSASQSDKTTRVNQMIRDLESALTATTTVALTDAADYAMTDAECLSFLVNVTGALTSPWNVTVPDARVKLHIVKDSTTGGQTVTFKTVTGTGIALTAGSWVLLYSDGTNVVTISTTTL